MVPENPQDYNPKSPDKNTSPKKEHDDTKKVVDTAAKGAAEYFAPGVGGRVYDTAKKVPVVGKQIDKATNNVASDLDKAPGVKETTKKLNETGVTDTVNKGIDIIGNHNASKPQIENKATKDTPTPTKNFRKNNIINRVINRSENETVTEEQTETIEQNELNREEETLNNYVTPLEENNAKDKEKKKETNAIEELKSNIFKKYKFQIIFGGGFICFFVLLIFFLLSGASETNNQNGYLDELCNYNETKVTLTDCYNSDYEETINIDEAVTKIAYLYTKDGKYKDEAIKALMIALKTNILSYGNYNNSDKNIDISICKLYNETTEEDIFNGYNKQSANLTSLYNEINEYLYISKSYQSTITDLRSSNALNLNKTVFDSFQESANNGKDYEEILKEIYNENDEDTSLNTYKDSIFIGDSRMQGMLNSGVINSSNTVYGVGYGYNWLNGNGPFSSDKTNAINGAVSGANSKMKDNTSYNIIIWLGVNDYRYNTAEKYFSKLANLAQNTWKNNTIYVVSVGPVDSNKATSVDNEGINNFNTSLKSLVNSSSISNLKYIDLGYTESSITYYDTAGLHYNGENYKKIYKDIMNNIDTNISKSLGLYKLTDYCTYYNLTENDAYWWPVGSANPTNGKIYGGAPVSVKINSTFGGRYHPVTGEWQKAHGAIDIGVSRGTPVIASKAGTVVKVVTGCIEGNYLCGGSYGNYIKIDHGGGIETLYAHLTSSEVKVGDTVAQGEIIARSGSTGRSTGPHLHFEVRINGTRVDPLNYVDADNPRPINYILTNVDGAIKIIGDTGNYSDRAKNKQIVCSSLLASGFSKNATIGIMANMETESAHTYDPSVVEYGSGYNINTIYNAPIEKAIGFGLIQWSYGRRVNLINYAKENGWPAASMAAQLNFMYHEISTNSGYNVTNKYITGNYSAYETAVAVCKNYERPKNSVASLTTSDSCTIRAQGNAPSMTTYVNNGCHD